MTDYEDFEKAIERFIDDRPMTEHGPGHIVLSDDNIEKSFVISVLNEYFIPYMVEKMTKCNDTTDETIREILIGEIEDCAAAYVFLRRWRDWLPDD